MDPASGTGLRSVRSRASLKTGHDTRMAVSTLSRPGVTIIRVRASTLRSTLLTALASVVAVLGTGACSAAPGARPAATARLLVRARGAATQRDGGCLLVARTEAEREAGLMRRTSLGGYIGMAFVFASPSTDGFWMRDTLIPLSVAWFADGGAFLRSADMVPCPPESATCPTWEADAPYVLAVEVGRGALRALGIGPGSSVSLGGACSPGGAGGAR